MTTNDRTALYFAHGQWSHGEDIVRKADETLDGLTSEALKSLGYSRWADIGDSEMALHVPLTLTIYSRRQVPRFYLDLEGDQHGHVETVYAETLPDLMELLARWLPALQAAAVTEVVSQLNKGPVHERERPEDRGVVALLRSLTGRSDS